MSDPIDTMRRLEANYKNTDIDWEGLLEADYTVLLSGRSDLGVIDIGGHAGRHSWAIQQKLRPSNLLIFEPLPFQRQRLEELFSHDKNVTVSGFALGNQSGKTTFVVKLGAPEESGLRQRSFYNDGNNDDLERILVNIETLDRLDIPFRVDFIKIDAEGGEIDILKGAVSLVRRDQPIISVEYGVGGFDTYGYDKRALFELACELKYSLFDLFGNRFASAEEWEVCVSRFYWDYLMIPNEKIAAHADRLASLRSYGGIVT